MLFPVNPAVGHRQSKKGLYMDHETFRAWLMIGIATLMVITGLLAALGSWLPDHSSENAKKLFRHNFLFFLLILVGGGVILIVNQLPHIGVFIDGRVIVWCTVIIGLLQITLAWRIFFKKAWGIYNHWVYRRLIPFLIFVMASLFIVMATLLK